MLKKYKNIFIITGLVLILLTTLLIVKSLITKKNEENFYNPEEITTIAGLTYTAIDYKDYKKLMDTKTSFMLVIGQEQCSACNRYSEALKQVRKDYGIRMYYLNFDKYAKELKEITTVQPTTLFVIDGVIKEKIEGNSAYQNLKMVLDELGY